MKKNTKKRLLSLLLTFVLCFSLTSVSVMAAEDTNIQTRAGGGATAKYIYGETPTEFTFPVSGSGMHRIRIEVSGTTSDNTAYVTVTPPGRDVQTVAITGNNTNSRYFITSLPAGTYNVYVFSYNSAVVCVYVE